MTLAIAEAVLAHACVHSGVSPQTLRSRTRVENVSHTRQIVCAVLRRRTEWSTPKIAKFLGHTDHSTVIHSVRRAAHLIENDWNCRELFARLMEVPPMEPFQLDAHIARMGGIEGEAPARKSRSIEAIAQREAQRAPIRPEPPIKLRPAITRPARAVIITEKDMSYGERVCKAKMVRGSKLLASAINRLRMGAGA